MTTAPSGPSFEDEFNALQSLYGRADNELRKTMEDTPPLPAAYDFGEGE